MFSKQILSSMIWSLGFKHPSVTLFKGLLDREFTFLISAIELNVNSKQPLPRGVTFQLLRFFHTLFSLSFKAWVESGASFLWELLFHGDECCSPWIQLHTPLGRFEFEQCHLKQQEVGVESLENHNPPPLLAQKISLKLSVSPSPVKKSLGKKVERMWDPNLLLDSRSKM